MELTFLGAAGTVTGSSYLLSVGDHRVMVDCGLYQGLPELEERNYTSPAIDWRKVDAILLTHAHVDHAGLIPRAVKLGFSGPVFTHPATIDLSEIILTDAAEQQVRDAEWLNRKRKRAGRPPVEPLYSHSDIPRTMRQFQRVEYEDPVDIVPGVTAEFRDAGHILGSASIAVDCVEGNLKRRIVFSGDIGHHQAPILREPLGFENADVVLIESTYGDRKHDSAGKREEMLRHIVVEANRHNSKVVIPSFAVGRTQELLYILSELLDHNEIPHIPIYLDSPMAIAATEVHERHPECFDKETLDRIKAGENPFHPSTLSFSRTVAQSRSINRKSGSMVIIAGGGMCEGGRIVHHLKHTLYDQNNHLIFVGYQAIGTLGRLIQDGERRLKLLGDEVVVRAKVTTIDAFSAHADMNGLKDWLGYFEKPPAVVFAIHGEEKATEALAEIIRVDIGFNSYVPRLNQRIDLGSLDNVNARKRVFAPTPLPGKEYIREITARIGAKGREFHPIIERYVGNLADRIKNARESTGDAARGIEDSSEIMANLAEAVGGDVEKLKELTKSRKTET